MAKIGQSRRELRDKRDLQREAIKTRFWVQMFTTGARSFDNFVKWGGITGCVALAAWAFSKYAGVRSEASLAGMEPFFASVQGMVVAGAGLGAVGGAGYWMQKQRRGAHKDDIERLITGKTDLEKKMDPKRETSSLTKRGETNPEDRS